MRHLAGIRFVDAIAAVCVVLLGASVAHRYVDEHFELSYDSAYRDGVQDLLYACIGRPGVTIDVAQLDTSPLWQAFVQRRVSALDCDALKGLPRVDAGRTADLQQYFHASLSALFWFNGPRRSVFINYATFFFGLTVLACYGLFRLGAGPLVASLASVPIIFSDLHLGSALHPGEYVKAPFMLGAWFFLGTIARREWGVRGLVGLSLAAGLAVGLGIGFRPDVLVCLPVAIVVMGVFPPPSVRPWRRCLAVALFLAAAALSGGPVLKATFFSGSGSLLPVQVLGGMDRSFSYYYAQPALYDYGIRFDDSHITYLINSYNQRVLGAQTIVGFQSKEMQRAATRLLVDIDRLFPADLLLRTWAAIVNVLKLSRFGVPAALVVIPFLLLANVRLGSLVVFLLLGTVGYVSLIFQTKHFFHLEWVPWWFVAVAVEQAATRLALPASLGLPAWLRSHARSIAALLLLVAAAYGAFMLVRRHQQSKMIALLDDYTKRLHSEPLLTATTIADDGLTRLKAEPLGLAARATPLVEDYLVLDVECGASGDADVVAIYEQATSPREAISVPCSTGPRRWKLFWPVYQYPPLSRFDRFEWKTDSSIRVRSVRRVTDLSRIPILLKLSVPDDYASRPWYQTLRRNFFFDPLGLRLSAKG